MYFIIYELRNKLDYFVDFPLFVLVILIISNRLGQHNDSHPHSTSSQQSLLRAECYLPFRTLGMSPQAVAGFSE